MYSNARIFIIFWFVIILIVELAGCSNWTGDGNAVSDKVDRMSIDVWSPMQSATADRLLMDQVQAFNENQRNIEVKLTLIERERYPDALNQVREDKQFPAVVALDLDQLDAFTEAQLLEPIDKMMSQRLWQDLLPDYLEQGHIGTHIYAVPAIHKADQDLLWSVLKQAEDKAATMAFIHYLLHPDQQRAAIAAGYTEPLTYSAR